MIANCLTLMKVHGGWLLLICAVIIFGNILALTGLSNCDPISQWGGLSTGWTDPFIVHGGGCFMDPAPANFAQPLGKLSADDWLRGTVPWWNPYDGLGMPLAAEMQGESLFLPFVLLLHFNNGWIWERLVLEMLSGLFTYGFLQTAGVSRRASAASAVLFGLNGGFYLTAGSVSATFFCLPLLLLGVERAAGAARAAKPLGWSLIALAIAWSLYAGFPETAYLDGLLGALWGLMRLVQQAGPGRRRLLGKLSLGGVCGVALAMPQLLPFIQYIQVGNSDHTATTFATQVWPTVFIPTQIMPYFLGWIGVSPPASLARIFGGDWGRIGSWFGCLPALLAFYALASGRGDRPARWTMAAWILAWEARGIGFGPAIFAFNMIPGMSYTDSTHYGGPALAFAVFVLAAWGFDDLCAAPRQRRAALAAGLFLACITASGVLVARVLPAWFQAYPYLLAPALTYDIGAPVLALMIFWLIYRGLHGGPGLMAGYLMLGAALGSLIPQASTTQGGQEQFASMDFLAANTGFGRVYDVGQFAGNYMAPFHIPAINYIALPYPTNLLGYIQHNIYQHVDHQCFAGNWPGQLDDLRSHLTQVEGLGVNYVVTKPGQSPFLSSQAGPPPRPVWSDQLVAIWALPHPAPYAEAPACRLTLFTRNHMSADCPVPATLLRRELFYPGWHAVVNGEARRVTPIDSVFQQISLPAGHSEIRFDYLPDHIKLACTLALAALALWLAAAIRARRLD